MKPAVRDYTPEERKAVVDAAQMLEKAGLEPLDVLSGIYLFQIHEALKKEGFPGIDIDVWHECMRMTNTALARKSKTMHPGVIEQSLIDLE